MKENELRVGNWVRHYDSWSYRQPDQGPFVEFDFQWNDNDWYQAIEACMEIERIQPIIISTEWLEKFGFRKASGMSGNTFYSLLTGYIELDWDHDGIGFSIEGQFISFPHIKYIHQLQNLYFALTGEELS